MTKFLSNEENTSRNLFDCEFEERIFQTESETLPEQLARSSKADEIDLSLSYADTTPVSFQSVNSLSQFKLILIINFRKKNSETFKRSNKICYYSLLLPLSPSFSSLFPLIELFRNAFSISLIAELLN